MSMVQSPKRGALGKVPATGTQAKDTVSALCPSRLTVTLLTAETLSGGQKVAQSSRKSAHPPPFCFLLLLQLGYMVAPNWAQSSSCKEVWEM